MTGTLVKKGKYYQAVIEEGYDASGQRKQKWISTRCEKKADAKKELSRILHEKDTNNYIDPCKYTLHTFLEEYKVKIKASVEPTTEDGYMNIIDNHLLKYFSNQLLLVDLSPKLLDDYFTFHLNNPGNPMLPQTLKRHKSLLKKALGYAVEMKMIKESPIYSIRLPKEKRKKTRVYDQAQISALLKAVNGDVIEPGVVLSIAFALRRGEALGLRWTDIDLERRVLIIQNTITKVRQTVEKGPKSENSLREFKISDRIYQYLQELKKRQCSDRELAGNSYIETNYLMRYADGSPISCSTYNLRFKELLEKNMLPPIRLHDLRHSMASIYHNTGAMTLFQLQEFMRHANLATTQRYVHFGFESVIDYGNVIDNVLQF